MAVRTDHLHPTRGDLMRLAAYASLLGDPEESGEDYWALRALFLREDRTNHWSSAFAVIPFEADALRRILRCVRAYNAALPPERAFSRLRIRLGEVLPVMLQLREPEAHVLRCVKEGFDHPGGIFHPKVLAYSQKRNRGLEGPTANRDVREDILSRIRE